MPATNKYGQYAINLHATGMATAVVIGGQLRSAIRTGTDVRQDSTDGTPYPVHQAIYSQEPIAEMQTYSVETLLDEIGTLGLPIAETAVTHPGLVLYAYKRLQGSTRDAAASISYTMANGMLLPVSLSCDHQGDATLDYQMLADYDSVNEPLAITDPAASLPAMANDNQRFTLGPLDVGGTVYDELKSAQIAFGINATRESADSDIWPTHVSIDDVLAVATFTGIDVTWLVDAKIPFAGGTVTTHVTGAFYLRLRDRSTVSQFATGAVNLKFTFDGLAVITDAFDAGGQDGATCTMTIPIISDGTNTPIVYTSGEALP